MEILELKDQTLGFDTPFGSIWNNSKCSGYEEEGHFELHSMSEVLFMRLGASVL